MPTGRARRRETCRVHRVGPIEHDHHVDFARLRDKRLVAWDKEAVNDLPWTDDVMRAVD